MSSTPLPSDIALFIEQEVASGRYRSEDELVVDAVRVLRELKSRHQRLCEDIQEGIRELEAGRGIELNGDADLRVFLDEIKKDGRRRLAAEGD